MLTTLKYCEKHGIPATLTIADNGSTDKTAEIARNLARDHKQVSYLHVDTKGVGQALKKAWLASTSEIIGYMDVDLATDLAHLSTVAEIFAKDPSDLVVTGSRLIPGSNVINRSRVRSLTSVSYNWILRRLLDVQLSDGMCGFKFMRRSAFERIMRAGVQNNEWFFNTEILVKAQWIGLPVREIPVIWTDDRDSRARILELTYKYLKEVLRLRSQRKGLKVHATAL